MDCEANLGYIINHKSKIINLHVLDKLRVSDIASTHSKLTLMSCPFPALPSFNQIPTPTL